MWARLKLDIGWGDLAYGLLRCALPPDRARLEASIERGSPELAGSLACFSVRTGFDLVLQTLDLPPRSELLFSALNIKGMTKIARRHDLVPVPLDLSTDRMLPEPAALERAITPRTRVLVVAPLFGSCPDLTALFEVARRHDLRVIEDCAQAFAGPAKPGNALADVSMFSFGPLKFATALGGAVLRVRDAALLEMMRKQEATYPVQPTAAYATRLLKFAGLKLMTTRPLLSLLAGAFRAAGRDYEDSLSDSVRGVARLGSGARIRKRCPPAMLALLARRLERFDPAELETRSRIGRRLLALLERAVSCPGSANEIHHFWAFPITVEEPDAVVAALRHAGFDAATLRRSAVVAAPENRPELDPVRAREVLSKLIVLPCYPGIRDRELQRLALAVRSACSMRSPLELESGGG